MIMEENHFRAKLLNMYDLVFSFRPNFGLLFKIIATGISITVVDKWGRRRLLLLSVSLMAISLLVIAFCKGVYSTHESKSSLVTFSQVFSFSFIN